MMKRWLAVLLVLPALAATACGGPAVPLNAGVKSVGLDVFFGTPSPEPAPPPAYAAYSNPFPGFPAPMAAAPRIANPVAKPRTPRAEVCPEPSPLAYAAVEALQTGPKSPPSAATYPFRFKATLTTDPGTPQQVVTHLPAAGTRKIANTAVSAPGTNGAYNFSVEQDWNGVQTTMVYNVQPTGPTGGSVTPVGTVNAGIYLVQMTDSTGASFTPNPPVQIMAFPAIQSNTFQGAGVDPIHAVAMVTNPAGKAIGRSLVNACGSVVDSIQVQIQGSVVNATGGQQKDFTLTFEDATQYGGIMVADHLVESGTDEITGKKFIYDVEATINVVPHVP